MRRGIREMGNVFGIRNRKKKGILRNMPIAKTDI